jgi:hypothetical protein
MTEDTVLRTLQALNSDLSDLSDAFVRLIKAARLSSAADKGPAVSGSSCTDIVVEALVAAGAEILNKLVTLKRGQIFGVRDRTLYETVRKTQTKLRAVTEMSSNMLAPGNNSPVQELGSLLRELEAHYSSSPFKPQDVGEGHPSCLDELCSEAMHAYLTLEK